METKKFLVKIMEEAFYEIEADECTSIEGLFDLIQAGEGNRVKSYLTEDYHVADRSTFEEEFNEEPEHQYKVVLELSFTEPYKREYYVWAKSEEKAITLAKEELNDELGEAIYDWPDFADYHTSKVHSIKKVEKDQE